MNVTFLEASVPLTKTYTKTASGITKSPYPLVWEFTSHKESFHTLAQLETLLTKHAALGHCMLKGTISRDLVSESRAGSTDSNSPTEMIVLDLDGLPDVFDIFDKAGKPHPTTLTIDLFLAELGIVDTSYIVQWSASYGIENKKLRAHVFMLVDRAYSAPLIKQWLMQKNHEVPLLTGAMSLTKTGNALSWPLDVSACQNDKLIYITPPVLKGLKDPMAGKTRITLVKKKHDKLSINGAINSSAKNRTLTDKRIADLREEAGLPARKVSYKIHGGQEVMLKPDECTITEMKTERGFTYFNLNGGDSWAYYHPEGKPDYILNFKGEPAYLTKELLPEYWQELVGAGSSTRTSSNGLMYLAFLDRKTGVYWRGTYDPLLDFLDLTVAKNETQLRHFCKQYGVPIGDFVPEWDLTFDPFNPVRVDPTAKIVNQFQPTSFMLNAGSKMPKAIPTTISKVLSSALGGDQAIIDHFINWLAVIIQTRSSTRTAWVLHGTHGTGKGILTAQILKPLFGSHTATRRMEGLNEKYNDYMENSFMVFIDEVQTKAMQNERGVMAKLKNFITEPWIEIRKMYASGIEVQNFTNWMFLSNMPDPISIDKEDRRINVAKYQNTKLAITSKEIEQIPKELQTFYDYLLNYPASAELAGTVLRTADRDLLIEISESSIDTVSNALLEGRLEFFLDHMPTMTNERNTLRINQAKDYADLIQALMARTLGSGSCAIARDELRVLYDFNVGNIPASPNKFTSLLKHHRMHMQAVWVNNKTVRGVTVNWKDVSKFALYAANFFAPAAAPAPVKIPAKAKLPAKKVKPAAPVLALVPPPPPAKPVVQRTRPSKASLAPPAPAPKLKKKVK